MIQKRFVSTVACIGAWILCLMAIQFVVRLWRLQAEVIRKGLDDFTWPLVAGVCVMVLAIGCAVYATIKWFDTSTRSKK